MQPHEPSFNIAAAFLRASEQSHHAEANAGTPLHMTSPTSQQKLSVAISREVGAHGTAVALETGRLLGWRVYDHELLEQIAHDLHVGIREVEAADERPGNWLGESIEAFGSRRAVTETSYFVHLRQAMKSLAEIGRCVIVGRGSIHLLPAETTLRVRIQAPLPSRIAAVGRERDCSEKDAARYIELETERRHRFLRDHFQREPADSRNYDLVLDSSRFSVTGCAEMIVQAVHHIASRESVNLPQATDQAVVLPQSMTAMSAT